MDAEHILALPSWSAKVQHTERWPFDWSDVV
jgi:hypothetical protein